LATTCYYLNWDRNRYRFGLTPALSANSLAILASDDTAIL
jgi:hypothetical protein